MEMCSRPSEVYLGPNTVLWFNGLTLLAYLNYTPRTPCRSTESRFTIAGPGSKPELMIAGVWTEEPLPSQPSTKSSETSATEGHTCIEVPRSAARTRKRGISRPHRIKTGGHFRRGAAAGQRGAIGARRRATGGQAGRCGPNAPRTAARLSVSVEHRPLPAVCQNNKLCPGVSPPHVNYIAYQISFYMRGERPKVLT